MHFYDPNPGRPDLVPTLRAMTIAELSAYCSAVLSERAQIALHPLPPTTDDVRDRRCRICNAALLHDTSRRGAPRKTCAGLCTKVANAQRARTKDRHAA